MESGVTDSRPQIAGGHVIVAIGPESQEENLAVWHVDDKGESVGAWSFALERTYKDREEACQVLRLIERRALISENIPAVRLVVGRLWDAAEVATPLAFEPVVVRLPEAVEEILDWRQRCEAAVEAEMQHRGRRLEPLAWTYRLPEPVPVTIDGLAEFLRLVRTDRTPATSEALLAARVARRIAMIWRDVEQVRAGRSYLVERLGPVQALPSTWASLLVQAKEGAFPS